MIPTTIFLHLLRLYVFLDLLELYTFLLATCANDRAFEGIMLDEERENESYEQDRSGQLRSYLSAPVQSSTRESVDTYEPDGTEATSIGV